MIIRVGEIPPMCLNNHDRKEVQNLINFKKRLKKELTKPEFDVILTIETRKIVEKR